jgi:hypothetical protein
VVTALGITQALLCALSLVAAVVILPVEIQIYRHLRRHHGKALDQMRIHSPEFLWREDRDRQDTAFTEFFSSRKHVTLDDLRLNALLRLKSSLWRTCGVSLVLLLTTFLLFRADPAHVWDLLKDLSHY